MATNSNEEHLDERLASVNRTPHLDSSAVSENAASFATGRMNRKGNKTVNIPGLA
jgi:hypothetical protein